MFVVREDSDPATLAACPGNDAPTPNELAWGEEFTPEDRFVLVRLEHPSERPLACVEKATEHRPTASRALKFAVEDLSHEADRRSDLRHERHYSRQVSAFRIPLGLVGFRMHECAADRPLKVF